MGRGLLGVVAGDPAVAPALPPGRKDLAPAQVLQRWSPVFHAWALCFGLAWGALSVVAARVESFQLAVLMYLVLATVSASAAAYSTAVFSVFLCFFISCWSVVLVAVYWAFPTTWQGIVLLAVTAGCTGACRIRCVAGHCDGTGAAGAIAGALPGR